MKKYTLVFICMVSFFFVFVAFTNADTEDGKDADKRSSHTYKDGDRDDDHDDDDHNVRSSAPVTMFTRQRAILVALGLNETELDSEAKIKQKFVDVQELTKGNNTYYKANFTGVPALAKQFEGRGLWGVIIGYLALSEDLTRVIGFAVISHKETPNLGGRMTEPWFTEQFRNEKIVDDKIIVRKAGSGDKNKDNGSIDGISGATKTSEGIQSILDKEITVFIQDLKR